MKLFIPHVFVATSSGSGLWEVATRSCIRRKVLCCTCGAFSRRWAEVCRSNGKEVTLLSVEPGRANRAEAVADALKRDHFDAVTYCHNETSTGVRNPLEEVARAVRDHSDALLLVDCVSSLGGMPLDFDGWGLDFALASSQKAFALPPGIALAVVSDRALERAREVPHRGYTTDLLNFKKYADRGQTPTTPSISHIYALDRQCDDMLAEGMDNRFRRHRKMAELVRRWARDRFALFAEEGYESDTVTCIRNTRGLSIARLNEALRTQHDCIISNGYGDLAEKTFRIGHMGDLQAGDIEALLGWLDDLIA